MSWFGGYRPQNQNNRQPNHNPDPQNLLVPDPDSSIDEGNINNQNQVPPPAAEAAGMAPTVNYDAHHADDEADNAMDNIQNVESPKLKSRTRHKPGYYRKMLNMKS